eukprot:CAMPEP_0196808534 /NCGR_PEP_ID=MMETSP1362-20130617/8526_1 /TAXON_ID=163516 /ORGANISM="Leptocylindrus danicus, Strain CCMP1856" /LENGTH=460 /DNA_ID=CAMNT_0042182913 /DNA_START=61 /DNA_END=1439 /DNA_ORIENTATION=+
MAHNYPAEVSAIKISDEEKLRTNAQFIYTALEEEGIFEAQTLGEVTATVTNFCSKLEATGLYDSVVVELGKDNNVDAERHNIQVEVNIQEKKWYKIFVGAGIKQQGLGMSEASQLGALPKAQFESSATLSNMRGCTDSTSVSYTIDQTSTPTFAVSHDAPSNVIIGDLDHTSYRAMVDTIDFEHARSYKEFQRSASFRLSNSRAGSPFLAQGIWKSVEWTTTWRDLLPCRFMNAPFACDASPNVISECGPSLKSSVIIDYRLNGVLLDNRLAPTKGFDYSINAELAGPPGDVGFAKVSKFISCHVPLNFLDLSLHASLAAGMVRPIEFCGACKNTVSISDRFFVGGPLQLRGFEPAGVGPRADEGVGALGGDSLGGELYYTSTIAASIPFPIAKIKDSGARLMGFANFGTLTGWGVPLKYIAEGTRASVGIGFVCPTPLGRVEATYAAPIKYGPRDKREA